MKRLVIFDVDGTLVDSQGDIVASMRAAFEGVGMGVPNRDAVLGIVGLSLDQAMLSLAPDTAQDVRNQMVEGYKVAYQQLRIKGGAASSPLYPGMADVVKSLHDQPDTVLAIATGKSRRGLVALMGNHGWDGIFQSVQVADDHPSKPHPSMILTALAETGIDADRAVMVGDTTFDMDMAGSAGVKFIGVDWGYHPAEMLNGAVEIISAAQDLPTAIKRATGGI